MLSVELKRLRLPLLIIVLCVMPTLAHANLSGWIWMADVPVPTIGYSLDEGDWLYFYSSDYVRHYNITTGQWTIVKPVGWVYADWPFYYYFNENTWMFALPPVTGLWVYHFSTGQLEVLLPIIP